MYIPTAFEVTDVRRLHAFMEQHSFATLVSHSGDGAAISHLPLLLDRIQGEHGTLIGHFARANPHWKVSDGQPATVVFHGPHTYISPTWYAEPNLVPTWNYVTVHAHGKLRLIEDRDALLEVLRRTVNLYESSQPTPWRLQDQDAAFIDKLLGAIIGFELPIERIEGKWKLGQNHPVERRERVIGQLQRSGRADDIAISQLMQGTLPPG